jgi:large subunit ribosomal protein L13
MKKNRTVYAKKEEIKRDWYMLDAAGQILGRMATRVAAVLRGKHKPIFTPSVDCGDFVVVVNADKVRISGKKSEQKIYFSHSGYPGGAKYLTFEEMMERKPEEVVRHAIAGMLPKGRLGRKMIKKLKVYVGAEHPHTMHKLQKLEI